MMDKDKLSLWRNAVELHKEQVLGVESDREVLEGALIDHLKNFFEWDEIEFTKNFDKVFLKFEKDISPVIKTDIISNLNMDWIIRAGYDDTANRIVVIEVYPFGLPKDGEIVWE